MRFIPKKQCFIKKLNSNCLQQNLFYIKKKRKMKNNIKKFKITIN